MRFNEPKPLQRVQDLTQEAFLRQYVAENRPVIVTDATDDWPARRERRDRESERLEGRGEQAVVLEAVAAAPAADELRLQALEIEANRTPQQDVQILERDVCCMREMQRIERRPRRP